MDDAKTLALAAGFGAIAGMRTFSAPLALSQAAREHSLSLAGTPLSALGDRQRRARSHRACPR